MDSRSSSASPISSTVFDEYSQKLQQAALKATRIAVQIPSDVSFHRTMDTNLSKDLDDFSTRLLSLTNRLLSLASTVDSTASSRDKGKARLQSQDHVVDHFQSVVVDCMDQLMERTDICLDDFLGRTKPPAIAVNPTPATSKKSISKPKQAIQSGHLDPALQHASHIPKPQLSFKRKIDNSDAPWYPSLTHKYNAKVPLGYDYRDSQDQDSESSIQTHPYRYEIAHFIPPARMFVRHTPTPPSSMSGTSFAWVSTPQEFQSMLSKLRQASEIAVDLEHNSYRSYAGFVCLMQLSTRQEDWIVDALALREELTELNEVFTDPEIVKVFHGAESDIPWLQQDFNLYIVNLFDTFHASKLLEFPRHGLANLLEMPLPDEMLIYARADTHFLLYVYDCLRNALIDRSQSQSRSGSPSLSTTSAMESGSKFLLHTAITRSRETSLRIYRKDMYDAVSGLGPGGWDTLARKWNKPRLFANSEDSIGKVQRAVYRNVHAWRDKIAREEDESTRYVLPNHYLFQLAEHPPNDMAALLHKFPSNPPMVIRRRAKELLDVVRDALRETLSSTAAQIKVDQAPPEVVQTETPTEEDVVESPVAERDIWAAGVRNNISITTKHSSLFTPLSAQAVAANSLTAGKSSLFGKESIMSGSYSTSNFKGLVSRINSTLVITPSVPKAIGTENKDASNAEIETRTSEDATGVLGMQVEIPFVPAVERIPKSLGTRFEDTIVVVGQTRAKKRKRNGKKTSEDGADISGLASGGEGRGRKEDNDSQEGVGETSGGQDDFDFSVVPNILDDGSDEERHAKQKRLKKQYKAKGSMFYGDFPAPPKAHSEFKGGNQSHTFKR
ncbi:hypothetical protein APHAL10511_002325 [Amanita phalloides]|nr:hypothetical protein APHAL10511_002325 [Amanita phalloides]